jgi:hypothetical protein
MNDETQGENTPQSFLRLRQLVDTRNRLVQRVESLPLKIEQAGKDAVAAGDEIVQLEVAQATSIESPTATMIKRHEVAVAAATKRQVEAEAMQTALKRQQVALEAEIARLDEEVHSECSVVNVDTSIIARDLMAGLAHEIEEAIKPLQALVAKVEAVVAVARLPRAQDFLVCSHVGNPTGSLLVDGPRGFADAAPNQLHASPADAEVARAEIRTALRPAIEALALVHQHKDYVPLSKRPAPYVRKGVEMEFKGGGLPPGISVPGDVISR